MFLVFQQIICYIYFIVLKGENYDEKITLFLACY